MKSRDVRNHRIFIQRLRLDRALVDFVSMDSDRAVEGERGRVARLDLIWRVRFGSSGLIWAIPLRPTSFAEEPL
jgi:hypothetical protein